MTGVLGVMIATGVGAGLVSGVALSFFGVVAVLSVLTFWKVNFLLAGLVGVGRRLRQKVVEPVLLLDRVLFCNAGARGVRGVEPALGVVAALEVAGVAGCDDDSDIAARSLEGDGEGR